MLDHLGLYLPAVVGEIDLLPGVEARRHHRREARTDEVAARELGLVVRRLAAGLVEINHVERARGYGQSDLRRHGRRRLDHVDNAAVVHAVAPRCRDPRPDNAALGQSFAGRHYY